MNLDRLEWINSGQEPPVDSEQRIIDPHHHLWERGGSRYRAEELSEDTSRGHTVTAVSYTHLTLPTKAEV